MESPLKIPVPSKEEIQKVREASKNIHDMARALHVSASTATKWLKMYDLPTAFRDKRKKAEEEKRQDFTEAESPRRIEADPDRAFVRTDVFEKPLEELTIADVCEAEMILNENNPHPQTLPEYEVGGGDLSPNKDATVWSLICTHCGAMLDELKQCPICGPFAAVKYTPADNDLTGEPEPEYAWPDDEPIPFVVTRLPEMQPESKGFRYPRQGKYESIGAEIGRTTDTKNKQYGDSFNQSGDVLRKFYPDGISPEQYDDMLAVVRIIDKLFRVANGKQGDENPFRDIAGYGILGAE